MESHRPVRNGLVPERATGAPRSLEGPEARTDRSRTGARPGYHGRSSWGLPVTPPESLPNKYHSRDCGKSSIARTERQLVVALTLDVGELFRRGVLKRGSRTRGVIRWLDTAGEVAASVSYEADMTNAGDGHMRLLIGV